MKPVLVLQHVPHETLGSLAGPLRAAGLDWQPIRLFDEVPDRLPLFQAAGLVVLGGPMNVDQTDAYPYLAREIDWICQALDDQQPVLGICLGAQLVAKACGARVFPNPVKEIGWYPIELTPEAAGDPLFGGCATRQTVFQWHGDTFELPQGAVLLARSELCGHQAFRAGPSAWGLQFHIEMTTDLVADWLDHPENRKEIAGLDYIDAEAIRAATPACLPRMAGLGDRVLPAFAQRCRSHGRPG